MWQRETFCCRNQESPATLATPHASLPRNISEPRIPEPPQLSGSVDSVIDDDSVEELNNISEPVEIMRPRIVRQDSCASSRSRGQERHITSDHLEKMVVSIIQEKEPNLQPLADMSSPSIEPQSDISQASSPDMEPTPSTAITEPQCASSGVSTEAKPMGMTSADAHTSQCRTTVVHGFSPSHVSIPSFRSIPQQRAKSPSPSAIPEPTSSPAPKPVQPKKQPPKFALGGSSGEESSPQSLEVRKHVPPKKKMFQVGGSSGEDDSSSLKSALHSSRPESMLAPPKKQASFSHQIAMRTIQTPSDQSDSYVDESAIDDDDEDSDWEDSIEESGKSSVENLDFKRVDSKANLTSHRSLISLMVAHDRAQALSNHASQSSSAIPQRARTFQSGLANVKAANANEPEREHGLMMKRPLRPTPLKPINEIPRSAAQPIMVNAQPHHHQAALSPRTTRRNMLATELTESLRRQLLWERQQKTSTANAVLKRRHTSHDVANLKQYPEKSYMDKGNEEPNSSSWNQYFNRESFGGYHAQGW